MPMMTVMSITMTVVSMMAMVLADVDVAVSMTMVSVVPMVPMVRGHCTCHEGKQNQQSVHVAAFGCETAAAVNSLLPM